jgi:hypothetical protein
MPEVLHQQTAHIAIPLRFKRMIKEIWLLQYRLQQKNPNKIRHSQLFSIKTLKS